MLLLTVFVSFILAVNCFTINEVAPNECPPVSGFNGNIMPFFNDFIFFQNPQTLGVQNHYTIAFWHYFPSSLPTTNINSAILAISGNGCDQREIAIISANAALGYRFAVTNCNVGVWIANDGVSDVQYDLDAWHHVAITVSNGNTITFFKNGVQLNTVIGSVSLNNDRFTFGIRGMNGDIGRGFMTEVKIWNRALNLAEIQSAMNTAGVGVVPNGLVSYYDGTVNVNDCVIDKTGSPRIGCYSSGSKVIPCFSCVEEGSFHTQSEGDWGDSCSEGFATGCYRDDNFDECFPNGVTVGCECEPSKRTSGCGYSIHLDSSAAVENFLPQLGSPDVLDQNYFNPANPPPMSTSSGNFGGQVTALALSLGFEDCDNQFHTDCLSLRDLYICDDRCSKCKRNGNCKKNNNDCRFLREYEEDETDLELRTNKNQNFNNNNNGKPKYANCEAFYGWTVGDIFNAANELLGGCGHCGASKRLEIEERNNNPHCSRNSECRKSEQARNNNHCNRNSDCKRNNNCCCCAHQPDPECDPKVLNACVTLINQAFIFGKTLDDVQSGTLFSKDNCGGGSVE